MHSILLVEDNPSDARLVELIVREKMPDLRMHWVRDSQAAADALRSHSFHVVVTDLGLPDRSGTVHLGVLKEAAAETPIYVLSGEVPRQLPYRAYSKSMESLDTLALDLHQLLRFDQPA
ncbi:MAG: hypothetical protein CMJ94_07930 [Planctomycetes bacterium]|nr:hypothetical protein [Planctomycetota bacterium]